MSIELILLAVNINLVSFSIYLQDIVGQVFVIFILTVAAAEAAIGLAIIVIYYKNKGSINGDIRHWRFKYLIQNPLHTLPFRKNKSTQRGGLQLFFLSAR